ncbi:hypothetical protein BH10ACT8_BH10ACT8_02320 [soil metagenome]|jgi:hypothetical protein
MASKKFDVTEHLNLQCRFGNGSLTVRAIEGLRTAEVTLEAREPQSTIVEDMTVALRGDTLVVVGPRPSGGVLDLPFFGRKHGDQDAVDITVTVPAGTAVKVARFAADVTLEGRLGGTDLAGGSGSTSVAEVAGNLRIRTGSGPVRIGSVTGPVELKSGASEIHLADPAGAVDVALGSGSLTISTARGPVRLRAGSCTVSIGEAQSDLDLTAGFGAVDIGLAEGQQARLDVVTGHGRLHTEMPVSQQAPASGRPLTVRAKTGSGDITIRRAVRA